MAIKLFLFIQILDLKKISKKRRIAAKKKSLTTSFFDIGKKDDQSKFKLISR